MSYADLTYYKNTWKGTTISDADTTKWLDRATDDIDIITNQSIDISILTTKQLDYLKKANCSQAEYYINNGQDGIDGESLSIGQFSISGVSKSNDNLCDLAYKYLDAAGLNFAGVGICDRYHDGY
jgi:hypothetical protein